MKYYQVALQLQLHGLELRNAKQYYNLREKPQSVWGKRPDDFMESLFDLLETHAEQDTEGHQIRYQVRYSYVISPENGKAIARNVEQVVWWTKRQEEFAIRFITDFCVHIDGTFNTNTEGLILGLATGVSHTGDGFPVLQSWMKSESKEAWVFFLQCIKKMLTSRNLVKGLQSEELSPVNDNGPKVIVSDFGKGLTAAIPESPFAYCAQQYCQWHCAEAFKKVISRATNAKIDGSYTSDEQKAICGDSKDEYGLIWPWLKSETETELEENRTALLAALLPVHQRYFHHTWLPFERQLITCYVKFLPNLGANSTQIGESGNARIKIFTNKSDSLNASFTKLMTGVNTKLNDIVKAELKQHSNLLRVAILDGGIRAITSDLAGQFSHRAVLGICTAYEKAQGQEGARIAGDKAAIKDAELADGDCKCKCEDMAR